MSLGLILLIVLVIFLIGGAAPFGPWAAAPGPYHGYGYGWGGGGVIGLILIVLLVLFLLGRI